MKFAKRFLSLFLLCCMLLGQLPARAAEVSGEVPGEDNSLLIVEVEGQDSSNVPEGEETSGVPSETQTSDPSPEDVAPAPESPEETEPEETTEATTAVEPREVVEYHYDYSDSVSIYYRPADNRISGILASRSDVESLTIPTVIGGVTDKNGNVLPTMTAESIGAYSNYSNVLNNNLATSLKTLILPDSLRHILTYSFDSCSGLETVHLPDGLETLEFRAFCYCRNLKSINLPDSITSIGGRAFDSAALTYVRWPKGAQRIEEKTFLNCASLSRITLPDGVTSIGAAAFSGCTSLKKITIPEGVTSIGTNAFAGCTSLKTLTIPASFSGELGTFADNSGIETLYLPASLQGISSTALKNLSNLRTIYFGGSEAAWKTFKCYKYGNIPAGVEVVFNYVDPGPGSDTPASPFVPKEPLPADETVEVQRNDSTWSPENRLFRIYP